MVLNLGVGDAVDSPTFGFGFFGNSGTLGGGLGFHCFVGLVVKTGLRGLFLEMTFCRFW